MKLSRWLANIWGNGWFRHTQYRMGGIGSQYSPPSSIVDFAEMPGAGAQLSQRQVLELNSSHIGTPAKPAETAEFLPLVAENQTSVPHNSRGILPQYFAGNYSYTLGYLKTRRRNTGSEKSRMLLIHFYDKQDEEGK